MPACYTHEYTVYSTGFILFLFPYQTIFHMSSLLYIIAIILVIGWILGFFVYSAGNLIHILLVIAVIAILFRLIRGRGI